MESRQFGFLICPGSDRLLKRAKALFIKIHSDIPLSFPLVLNLSQWGNNRNEGRDWINRCTVFSWKTPKVKKKKVKRLPLFHGERFIDGWLVPEKLLSKGRWRSFQKLPDPNCFPPIYFSAVQLFIKKTMVFPVYYHKCYILSVTWNQMLSAGLYRLLLLSTKKMKLNTFCWGISKVGTSNIGELGNKDNSNSYIHTLMVVTAMQGADQHIRSSLRFSILPKDTWSCRPWESNQQPSNNKMLKNSCPLDSWCITVVGGLLAVV